MIVEDCDCSKYVAAMTEKQCRDLIYARIYIINQRKAEIRGKNIKRNMVL